jgi:long-chain acyl-CoA synthetase
MQNFGSIHKGPSLKELPVPGKTLPEIFLKQVAKYGSSRAALRYKSDGTWKEHSWRDFFNNVEKIAGGLMKLGISPQDKICLLSANCPEWLFISLAVQSLGAFLVPIYTNNTAEQTKYVVEHSEAKLLFVQNQEQLSKTDNWRNNLNDLNKTILIFGEPPTGVMKNEELITLGAEQQNKAPGFLKDQIDRLTPDSPGGIIYTSGTTGPPKGVILAQKNLVFMAASLLTRYDFIWEEDTISFLPLSHIAEQVQNISAAIIAAFTVSFAQSLETMKDELAEVRPTLFFSVPRLYEKVHSTILETVSSSPFIKRSIFNWALGVGEKIRQYRNSSKDIPFATREKWNLANKIVFSKLKTKLGLDRAHFFGSGAAPLSAEVSRFFGAMGMDIFEFFGQTECTGVCNSTDPGTTVPGAVGPPLPGCEVAIADDGEIVTRGDHVFSGYWKDKHATDEALKDGWLYTGDIGFFDDEKNIHITDRKKDIIVTAGGKNVAPQNIENLLKLHQGISQAVVIGDKRKHLTCLFTLDAASLPKLCEQLGIDMLTPDQAVTNQSIINKVQEYVDKVNVELAQFETIKYFRILPRDFSVETGELTPTLKMKRRVISEKYKQIIDSMYIE